MKRIKWLLLALGAMMCMSLASCSMPSLGSGFGSGGGQNSTSDGGITDDSKDSGGKTDDTVGGEDQPTDSSDNGKDSTGGSDDSSSGDPIIIPGDVPEIPEGQIYVDVIFFTIITPDGAPLQQGYFVDDSATLDDFLDEYIDDMVTYLAETEGGIGFSDQYGNENGEEVLRKSFWQVAYYLIDGEDRFSDYFDVAATTEDGGVYFSLIFTPSGAGPNMTIYNGWEDYNRTEFPFPYGVCLRDTVNWAYENGFFEMSYEESVKVGAWRDYWGSDVTLEWDSCASVEIVFDRSSIGEGGTPQETSFTVYMPMIYDFGQYEDGSWDVGSTKLPMHEFWGYPTGVTLRDALSIVGVDSYYTWVCYMNGERISEETVLTQDCVVVCVAAEADRIFDPFTVTVSVEGQKAASYTYTSPVSMWDCATLYCKANGLDFDAYTWYNDTASTAAISEIMLAVRDITLYGCIAKEPEVPTEATVTVYRYDGEKETTETYAVPYGSSFGEFVQANFWSEYNDSNSNEYEYAFYGATMGYGGEMSAYEELKGSYKVWMIKRSVLEQGYNVSVDLMTSDCISETDERTMYYPANLRTIVLEVTGHDRNWDSYLITINGEVVCSSEKSDYYENCEERLYYKDLTIVIKPIFELNVSVLVKNEAAKSKTLTYYGEVTPKQVAKDLGLSREADDYLWKTGWSSDSTEYLYTTQEPLMMRLQSGGYLFVEARKVLVDIYYTDSNGVDMFFLMSDHSYGSYGGWDWSVTAKDAFDEVCATENFDDYIWTAKLQDGSAHSVNADSVLDFVNTAYTGDSFALMTVYTLTGRPKAVQVKVSVQDGNGNETILSDASYESSTAIGTVLYALGYSRGSDDWTVTKDGENYWFMVELYSGYGNDPSGSSWSWATEIRRSIRIVLYKY